MKDKDMLKRQILPLMLALFLWTPLWARAEVLNAHDIVEVAAKKVMLALKDEQKNVSKGHQHMVQKITLLLEPIVAFDSIAHSVMGKYKKQATDEQKIRFAKVFKVVMVDLYVKALLVLNADKVVIIPPEEGKKYKRKTKVMTRVTSDIGENYNIIYSMRQNKQGEWQARNMIVDGINLGLTYLNQFDSSMNRHNKDIDKVIDSWKDDMIETDDHVDD